MRPSIGSRVLVTLCAVVAVVVVPPAAQQRGASLAEQELASRLAPLALLPEADPFGGVPPACGTPWDFAIQHGLARAAAAIDGEPLYFDQTPRILRATYTGSLVLQNFLVVGDLPTVTFERLDPAQESGKTVETWQRTGTKTIGGRVISIFNPSWSNATFLAHLSRYAWGIDQPYLKWGDFVVPAAPVTTADGMAEPTKRGVYVLISSTNIPSSTVTQISSTVQFASHVVNIHVPDFADLRVGGADDEYVLRQVATEFYKEFPDEYDFISVISQTTQVEDFFGFHRIVRNEIAGLGLSLFDRSAEYGSAGRLKGIEFYPPGGYGSMETSNHEIEHQWGDYYNWRGMANSFEAKGHQPEAHTPLLTPGEVFAGAVLEADRRVAVQAATTSLAGAHGPTYVIERSPTPQTYHPTTLHRMGLIAAASVPPMQVFMSQGQFKADTSSSPDAGTVLQGEHDEVTINEIMQFHGTRSGPVPTELRRATVIVSRNGLLPKEEMDHVNFYAARHAAAEGVTTYDGMPGFFEATGKRLPLKTDITPKTAQKITTSPTASYANLGAADWPGILFDNPIPGRIRVGQRVNLDGRVTATDRSDYRTACFRFRRNGAANANEIFFCAAISGNRFSTGFTFGDTQKGTYVLDSFLFFDDTPQFPKSAVSGMVVD